MVLPEEANALELTAGKDYCTLVTCTPYGINTHRLLVRGSRMENLPQEQPAAVEKETGEIREERAWPPYLWAAPIPAAILIGAIIWRRKKRGK